MALYLWGAGGGPSSIIADLITNVKLNQNGQPLFKGTVGWEDTLQLGYYASDGVLTFLPNSVPMSPIKTLQFKANDGTLLTYVQSDGKAVVGATVQGALTIQPTVDPSAGQQVFQVNAANGTNQFAVTATGGVIGGVASLATLVTPSAVGPLSVSGQTVVSNLIVNGTASINVVGAFGVALPRLIVSGLTSMNTLMVAGQASMTTLGVASTATFGSRIVASNVGSTGATLLNFIPSTGSFPSTGIKCGSASIMFTINGLPSQATAAILYMDNPQSLGLVNNLVRFASDNSPATNKVFSFLSPTQGVTGPQMPQFVVPISFPTQISVTTLSGSFAVGCMLIGYWEPA